MKSFIGGFIPIPFLVLLSCATINGLYFSNKTHVNAKETGICSFYGAPGEIPEGWPTASGEPFHRMAMRAAHRTLKFKTRIRVTNLANNKKVDVIINDRGPFKPGRIVDLTWGAFGRIAQHSVGLIKCSYDII